MICRLCQNDFNIKRTILNLFDTKEYFICPKCLEAHPFKLEFNVIPLDNHLLEIVSLFKRLPPASTPFIREESSIYCKLIQAKKEHQIIFCDTLYLNEQNLGEYNAIAANLDKDILIMTDCYILEE